MPISTSRLAQRVLRVTVRVPDEQGEFVSEELKVTHKPVTLSILNHWREAAKENEGWSTVDELSEILIDMDLVDDHGKPVKPTRKVLETLDLPILRAVHKAIMEDIFPNEQP